MTSNSSPRYTPERNENMSIQTLVPEYSQQYYNSQTVANNLNVHWLMNRLNVVGIPTQQIIIWPLKKLTLIVFKVSIKERRHKNKSKKQLLKKKSSYRQITKHKIYNKLELGIKTGSGWKMIRNLCQNIDESKLLSFGRKQLLSFIQQV